MHLVCERGRLFKEGPLKIEPELNDLEENRILLCELGLNRSAN